MPPRNTGKRPTPPPQPKKQDTEYTDGELLIIELRQLNVTLQKLETTFDWIATAYMSHMRNN